MYFPSKQTLKCGNCIIVSLITRFSKLSSIRLLIGKTMHSSFFIYFRPEYFAKIDRAVYFLNNSNWLLGKNVLDFQCFSKHLSCTHKTEYTGFPFLWIYWTSYKHIANLMEIDGEAIFQVLYTDRHFVKTIFKTLGTPKRILTL